MNKYFRSQTVYSCLEEAEKIIIGLSGGADSIALTHILFSEFGKNKLVCAHINHQIRGDEAIRDENFAKDFCEKLGVECRICHVNIPKLAKEKGIGEEECGRIERYKFFNSLCEKNSVIATAHNADDNSETVLMNLIRGCGISGLKGIPEKRDNVLRPILCMTRAEIEKYCSANSLEYITDSTNFENDYSRNKIRNCILPMLCEINSGAKENITRTSDIICKASDYIYSNATKILQNCRNEYGLDCNKLNENDEYIVSEAIKLFLVENSITNYEEKHITKILESIKSSGSVTLPNKKIVLIKQGVLSVYTQEDNNAQDVPVNLGESIEFLGKKIEISKQNLNLNVKINNLLFKNLIDCDKIIKCLIVGTRKNGDYFYPQGRNVGKSLKKLFNEAKIPSHLRDKIIVIRDNDNIVYIEGFGVSEKYKVENLAVENIALINIENVEGF